MLRNWCHFKKINAGKNFNTMTKNYFMLKYCQKYWQMALETSITTYQHKTLETTILLHLHHLPHEMTGSKMDAIAVTTRS